MKIGFVHLKGHFAVNVRNSAIYDLLVSNGMDGKDILIEENKYLESSYKGKSIFHYVNIANTLTGMKGFFFRQSVSSIINEISFNNLAKKYKMMLKGEYKNLLKAAEECDVLHAEDIWCGYLCRMIKKELNKPYILDLHDSNVAAFSAYGASPRKIEYYREIESKAVLNAKFVTAVSKSARSYLSNSYDKPENEIFVAPNGTQLLEAKAHFNEPFKIIYAGGFERKYNILAFLRAAEILNNGNYEFYILGDGSLRNEIIDYINKKHVNVSYLGFKNRKETLKVLSTMQVGICPLCDNVGNQISSPIKSLDYAACGLPIIITDVSEISLLIKKYDCGIVVKRNDPTEFANAIKKLNNKDIWEKKSINAKKMIEKELTWQQTLKPLLMIYKNLL